MTSTGSDARRALRDGSQARDAGAAGHRARIAAALALGLATAFCACRAAEAAKSESAKASEAVIVVFPFKSPADGETGRKLADRLRLRARRLGLIVVDRLSTRDAMSGAEMPTLSTPPTAVAVLLRDRFQAHLGLWGFIEPVGGGLRIDARGVDVRGAEPRSIVHEASVREPQLLNPVQDAILEKLSGLKKDPVAEATPEADAKVPTKGPNLVKNGGFEKGEKHPTGWDRLDGLTTFRVSGVSPTGKCLKIDTDVYHEQWVAWRKRWKEGAPPEAAPQKTPTSGPKYNTVAGIYGVGFVSDPISVKPGKAYKVEVDYRCKSTDFFFPKVFMRGYGDVQGEKRVVYDAYLALRSLKDVDAWKHGVRICRIPTDTHSPVEFVKLKLYAYWPPGVYYFDNASLKEAVGPIPGEDH
jgi:hypothetical protein